MVAVRAVAQANATISSAVSAPATTNQPEPSRWAQALDTAREVARLGPKALGFALALPAALMRPPRDNAGGFTARKPIANIDPNAVANLPMMPLAPPMPPGAGPVLAGGPGGVSPIAANPAGIIATGAAAATKQAAPYIVNAGINWTNAFMEGVDAANAAGEARNDPMAKQPGDKIVNDNVLGEVDVSALERGMGDEIKRTMANPEFNLRSPGQWYDHFKGNSDMMRQSLQRALERAGADPANPGLQQRATRAIEAARGRVVLPANADLAIDEALNVKVVLH